MQGISRQALKDTEDNMHLIYYKLWPKIKNIYLCATNTSCNLIALLSTSSKTTLYIVDVHCKKIMYEAKQLSMDIKQFMQVPESTTIKIQCIAFTKHSQDIAFLEFLSQKIIVLRFLKNIGLIQQIFQLPVQQPLQQNVPFQPYTDIEFDSAIKNNFISYGSSNAGFYSSIKHQASLTPIGHCFSKTVFAQGNNIANANKIEEEQIPSLNSRVKLLQFLNKNESKTSRQILSYNGQFLQIYNMCIKNKQDEVHDCQLICSIEYYPQDSQISIMATAPIPSGNQICLNFQSKHLAIFNFDFQKKALQYCNASVELLELQGKKYISPVYYKFDCVLNDNNNSNNCNLNFNKQWLAYQESKGSSHTLIVRSIETIPNTCQLQNQTANSNNYVFDRAVISVCDQFKQVIFVALWNALLAVTGSGNILLYHFKYPPAVHSQGFHFQYTKHNIEYFEEEDEFDRSIDDNLNQPPFKQSIDELDMDYISPYGYMGGSMLQEKVNYFKKEADNHKMQNCMTSLFNQINFEIEQ